MKNVNYLIKECVLNKLQKKLNPILLGKCRESVYTTVYRKTLAPINVQINFSIIAEIQIWHQVSNQVSNQVRRRVWSPIHNSKSYLK